MANLRISPWPRGTLVQTPAGKRGTVAGRHELWEDRRGGRIWIVYKEDGTDVHELWRPSDLQRVTS